MRVLILAAGGIIIPVSALVFLEYVSAPDRPSGIELGLLTLGLGLGLVGLYAVIIRYLQKDPTRYSSTRSDRAFNRLVNEVQKVSLSSSEFARRLSKVEDHADRALSSRDLQDSDRAELVASLQKSIEKAASEDFLDGIRRSIAEGNVHFELQRELNQQHDNTVSRLSMELRALTRRGNVNLSFGITTAIVGMAILSIFVFTLPSADSALEFARSFFPRISLVILIEVFAYFFLRLYSNSLIEIKYFQNEITNIESKFVALRAAAHPGNEKSMGDVILNLSQTERNYVLRKGQTTVDVERSKMEKETVTSLLETILKTVSRK